MAGIRSKGPAGTKGLAASIIPLSVLTGRSFARPASRGTSLDTTLEQLPDYEGLDPAEALVAASQIMRATTDRLPAAGGLRDTDADLLARARAGLAPSADDARRLFDQLLVSGLVLRPEVLDQRRADSLAADKWAIRHALAVLAAADPRILSAAMGVALSTVYSYSDLSRTNHPGAKRLFRAAFLFRFVAQLFNHAADNLLKVARMAPAVKRGRPRRDR